MVARALQEAVSGSSKKQETTNRAMMDHEGGEARPDVLHLLDLHGLESRQVGSRGSTEEI